MIGRHMFLISGPRRIAVSLAAIWLCLSMLHVRSAAPSLPVVPVVHGAPTADSGIAPDPDDPGYPWIKTLQRHVDPLTIDIHLTASGLAHAATCDGAPEIALAAITLYDRFPAPSEDIAWAEDRMTQEIYGHGRAAAGDIPVPNAAERANPIDIVFAHYTDMALFFTDFEAWTFQRGYATLYRVECPS
jgi:hypothetical protein